MTANIRAQDGWFGPDRRAPDVPRDARVLSEMDLATLVAAFQKTGFSGANAWYMQDASNLAYAAEAPDFGRLGLPVLYLHAAWDAICNTAHSRLAEPMREDCADLSEVTIEAGHWLMLEQADAVNQAMSQWLAAKSLG